MIRVLPQRSVAKRYLAWLRLAAIEHEKQGVVEVTGSFRKPTREDGKVTTVFTKAKICGTSKYSTATK